MFFRYDKFLEIEHQKALEAETEKYEKQKADKKKMAEDLREQMVELCVKDKEAVTLKAEEEKLEEHNRSLLEAVSCFYFR